MKPSAAAPSIPDPDARALPLSPFPRRGALAACAACAVVLAGCASTTAPGPGRPGPGGRYFDPLLGVWASPRVVEDGQAVPRGGGGFLVGRPYTIGGRLYVPNADPRGYVAAGTASWYGDAFHGRRTANGEVFDKGSISAAHPTLPLPSYVRVTNLKNGRSMVVRVNDRGPYHGGRVMDVSQRVAEALAFRDEGTGRVRIEYLGRAGLSGDDDDRLLATLTTDGRPARLDGVGTSAPGEGLVPSLPPRPTGPSPLPNFPARVASLPLFRRGHAAEGALAPPSAVEPVAAPVVPPLAPSPGPLPAVPRLSRLPAPPLRASAAAVRPAPEAPGIGLPGPRAGRGAPARDPFFKPLFPPPKPERAPPATISFGAQARDAGTARKAGRPRPDADGELR